MLHKLGALCYTDRNNREKYQELLHDNVLFISEHFDCEECRNHFGGFCRNTPIIEYFEKTVGEKKEELGALYWTYLAHDHATQQYNKHSVVKKKRISWDECLKIWLGTPQPCTECEGLPDKEQKKTGIPVIKKK